jgi:Uma2 family endonuclease
MAEAARVRATIDDLMPLIERGEPFELVDGEIVRKASPDPVHGGTQAKLTELLGPLNRKPGPRGPGGWWIMTEVDTRYALTSEVFRHDAQGYRRDLHPERPTGFPVSAVPQWVCEILSASNARVDLVKKQRSLHAHRVGHYWVIDPAHETLTVLRWHEEAYLSVLTAGRGDAVRAEPFAEVEISIDDLLGYE